MADIVCSAFSEEGKYFGYCGVDGKLKIWDTESGVLSREYTPNLHLSSPCTCLIWVASIHSTVSKKKKKLKLLEPEKKTDALALGTTSGSIMMFNVASGNIVSNLKDGHHSAVNDIAWRRGTNLFSCDDKHIIEWNVENNSVKRKWKAGKERVSRLLVLPDGKSLLVAGCTIGLWDIPSEQLVRTYTGHTSEITSLTLISSGDNYFISGAKNDHHLSAWSLSSKADKNAVASFVMEDVAVCVYACPTDSTCMVTVSRTGVLHLFRHQLNGKCAKPIKPKVTVQIASRAGDEKEKETVHAIPILSAQQNSSAGILIAHGTYFYPTFEIIKPNENERTLFLVRETVRRNASQQAVISKVKIPEVGDNVEYVSSTAVVESLKRSRTPKLDVPMEERLDNLSLTRPSTDVRGTPQADSMAHLLAQGLHSKDKKILQNVLTRNDPVLISKTVKRLSIHSIVPLLEELVTQVQGRTMASHAAVLWLKAVITTHAGHLLANPYIKEIISPIFSIVETRLGLLASMSRLRGRLDLLVDQIGESSKKDADLEVAENLFVYQDQDSDEGSIMDDIVAGSESDDHWEELSEMDIAEEDEEEVEMSS